MINIKNFITSIADIIQCAYILQRNHIYLTENTYLIEKLVHIKYNNDDDDVDDDDANNNKKCVCRVRPLMTQVRH